MSTCGLRGCVVGCKKANVGEWGHVGWKADILGVSSSIWRSTQHYGEFLQCSYSAFVMVGLPLGERERGRRERKKERVCEENCLQRWVCPINKQS